jgi:DNA polymerase III subunit epsilon
LGKQTLIFDTETTGLAAYDRVVSIAGVWCDGLEPTGEHFYLVFNPRKASHPAAAAAHGLSDWWLRYQPAFEAHAAELRRAFDRADLVVGHNIGFDIRMIGHEFAKCGVQELGTESYCTMAGFRSRVAAARANLDFCLDHIGQRRSTSVHSAFEDSFLTMNLYRWLHDEKTCCAPPSPLPAPSNAVNVPKEITWADVVDATPSWQPCPAPPESVIAMLAKLGIDVAGHSPRTARMLLAAHDYARILAKRSHETDESGQIRGLICALADADAFQEPLMEWSRWSWGRPNPPLPRDALRSYAEEVLAGLE